MESSKARSWVWENLQKWLKPGFKLENAKKPLDFALNKADVKDAKRLNPTQCPIARACERLYGIPGIIYRGVAYVPSSDTLVLKYEMASSTTQVTRLFDQFGAKKEVLAGMIDLPIHLIPPTKHVERPGRKANGHHTRRKVAFKAKANGHKANGHEANDHEAQTKVRVPQRPRVPSELTISL